MSKRIVFFSFVLKLDPAVKNFEKILYLNAHMIGSKGCFLATGVVDEWNKSLCRNAYHSNLEKIH